jgi:uncharacterized protein (TIGR02453 family)
MAYFERGYIDFLQDLKKNNTQRWFDANRKRYEESVREPFKAFVEILLPKISVLDPEIRMEAKDAIFRINRDQRFHQDDAPYRIHMAAGFSKGGRKSQFAGYFIHFGIKNLFIGGGVPFLEKESLKKIRIEIAFRAYDFKKVTQSEPFANLYGNILGENTGHIPKEFSDMYLKEPLIGNKQFYYGAMYSVQDHLFRGDLDQFVYKHFAAGKPVNEFLKSALGKLPFKKVARAVSG